LLKTHNCGELNIKNVDQKATLAGWVNRRRDHGGLIFIDLRDREGLTQVVFGPEHSKEVHGLAGDLRSEYVIKVTGDVSKRPTGTENTSLPTGEIELIASGLEILNDSKVPPFYINKETDVDEYLRLQYRYLDLRRPRMQQNMILRHKVIKFMRSFLDKNGFIEIETPILTKSTPEGARDYLVPSRLNPGNFYALPQSPQQLKQLLMVAGFEKYFQIARCFRDEDQRADRQPEFTQLDLEMSFVEQEDILQLMEKMYTLIIEEISGKKLMTKPFPRLTCQEAMDRFGKDSPDLRFGMELADLSDIFTDTEFGVFKSVLDSNGHIKGICTPGCGGYSRKQRDELIGFARNYGAKGLVTLALGESVEDAKSQVLKYLTNKQIAQMSERLNAKAGDLILIVADQPAIVAETLGQLRIEMANRLGLRHDDTMAMAWILKWPLFQWNEAEKRWDPSHHLFTAPAPEDIPLLDTNPGAVRGLQHDLVCNNYEIGGGSIRIHQRAIQEKVFELIGLDVEDAKKQFGHMLEAFQYGAPPHGGIASGIERFVMLLAGEPNIREVMAFPKTQSAADPMVGAPSPVAADQLSQLRLQIDSMEDQP
jgi:aspartyl-tRNA synthetase